MFRKVLFGAASLYGLCVGDMVRRSYMTHRHVMKYNDILHSDDVSRRDLKQEYEKAMSYWTSPIMTYETLLIAQTLPSKVIDYLSDILHNDDDDSDLKYIEMVVMENDNDWKKNANANVLSCVTPHDFSKHMFTYVSIGCNTLYFKKCCENDDVMKDIYNGASNVSMTDDDAWKRLLQSFILDDIKNIDEVYGHMKDDKYDERVSKFLIKKKRLL